MPWVSATSDGPRRVKYVDENGCWMVRIGGTRAWRTNNPGNVTSGGFAGHGEIGDETNTQPHQRIYPDFNTGKAAMTALLSTSGYMNLTVDGALRRWNTVNQNSHNNCVHQRSGIDLSRQMTSLSATEMSNLVDAMIVCEGWSAGSQTSLTCP